LQSDQSKKVLSNERALPVQLSIIIPTYNESENILNLLASIKSSVLDSFYTEIIVVDDNSPDKTGNLAEDYSSTNNIDSRGQLHHQYNLNSCDQSRNFSVRVVHRSRKHGLVSAILEGIKSSNSQYVVVMDADFSHSPDLIPKMVRELENADVDIVVASRYAKGGSIVGWPFKRKLISKCAAKIAEYGLHIRKEVKDPMSGFFAFKRPILRHIRIDSAGYKILLEILVKAKEAKVKEIPYTFTDRKAGKSKLDNGVMLDYIKAVYNLYRYGRRSAKAEVQLKKVRRRKSALFLSKAGRFYTVGASGLLLNYITSIILSNSSATNFGYLHAAIVGIVISNLSNFFFNKAWTFEDRDFSLKKTLRQYGLFAGISSGGAAIQLDSLYLFIESGLQYESSLLTAVALASVSNFLLNKKFTFGEKLWG
jgi:dolichol-phosphate mannosyltransferase